MYWGTIMLVRWLCVGLLVHFFLHTRVTFGVGRDLSVLWGRKEGVVLLLILFVGIGLVTKKSLRHTLKNNTIFWFLTTAVSIGIIGSFFVYVYIFQGSLGARVLAMRYDYLGFVLVVVGVALAGLRGNLSVESVLRWYGRVMKRCLILALCLWVVVAIKPGTMKLFGYNNYIFEGTIGEQPPAVYYTHINYGLPRSQFLFERPTTYGFWLTAFFPLFFVLFLTRRPWYETWGWWGIYGLNVLLTFSRAARGSRIVIVLLLFAVTTNIPRKKLFLKYGIPLLVIFGGILLLGREQIALRSYSNYGHITMLKQGWAMFLDHPWRGNGPATAGPGSHRGGVPFNPENQFLQLWVEFGVLGSLPWMILWFWTTVYGFVLWGRYRKVYGHQAPSSSLLFLLAGSGGMVTLTLSGMVLHTFADRMVVYPFMLLYGLAFGSYLLFQDGSRGGGGAFCIEKGNETTTLA